MADGMSRGPYCPTFSERAINRSVRRGYLPRAHVEAASDWKDIEAVKEVLAELTRCNAFFEALMGGGNDAHVTSCCPPLPTRSKARS